jgi:HAD superfamily hydrolase (TIGR01549 family)
MLTDNLKLRQLVEAEDRYPKELEEPYQGAERILQALSQRYRIGVIANQSGGTEARLTRWGLMPFISICLSSTETGLEKPDLAIFRLALAQARSGPRYAVMIGDRLDNDSRPARLLGWKTIRILQGGYWPNSATRGPKWATRSFPSPVDYREPTVSPTAWCRQHAFERRIDQLADRPNVIGHPELHGWSDSSRFVDSAKIVVRDIEGNGCDMVLQLF